MQLRDALKDYKRNRDHRTRFPGECRTTSGRFSGRSGRLVHVGESGQIRDFSYPLTGLTGIVRSRFGVRPAGDDGGDGV
ncbi:glucan 1,4-alpha-glucosidase, partial [Halogeometricum sp. CBA1124]|nr:glucan 1,4-alpha-glucosidase [Halogeometricum sp. CBA1124]